MNHVISSWFIFSKPIRLWRVIYHNQVTWPNFDRIFHGHNVYFFNQGTTTTKRQHQHLHAALILLTLSTHHLISSTIKKYSHLLDPWQSRNHNLSLSLVCALDRSFLPPLNCNPLWYDLLGSNFALILEIATGRGIPTPHREKISAPNGDGDWDGDRDQSPNRDGDGDRGQFSFRPCPYPCPRPRFPASWDIPVPILTFLSPVEEKFLSPLLFIRL